MWPFKRSSAAKQQPLQQGRVAVPFPPDIADLPVLKYHMVRALCSVFMSRHSGCRSPHPFCGDINATVVQLIANAVQQVNENDGTPLLAIYLSKAVHSRAFPKGELIDPWESVLSLGYAEETPHRKLVVRPTNDGTYFADYGPILNPVEGDYATGRIDLNAVRILHCDPEPRHTKWQYWECELLNENITPEFHCLMVRGEWWIVDTDREQGLVQQVAALSVADDPEHNFGIHARENTFYGTDPRDDSEYAKVIRENLPSSMFPGVADDPFA